MLKRSYACSDDYHIFVRLGYPQLDRIVYPCGEWAIREFYSDPIIPCMTQWKVVFSGFKNVEFNESFVKRMVDLIDLQKREFWAKEEEKQAAQAKREADALNARADAHGQVAKNLIKSDALMERASRIGPEAFSLDSILSSMSESQVKQVLGSRVQFF